MDFGYFTWIRDFERLDGRDRGGGLKFLDCALGSLKSIERNCLGDG